MRHEFTAIAPEVEGAVGLTFAAPLADIPRPSRLRAREPVDEPPAATGHVAALRLGRPPRGRADGRAVRPGGNPGHAGARRGLGDGSGGRLLHRDDHGLLRRAVRRHPGAVVGRRGVSRGADGGGPAGAGDRAGRDGAGGDDGGRVPDPVRAGRHRALRHLHPLQRAGRFLRRRCRHPDRVAAPDAARRGSAFRHARRLRHRAGGPARLAAPGEYAVSRHRRGPRRGDARGHRPVPRRGTAGRAAANPAGAGARHADTGFGAGSRRTRAGHRGDRVGAGGPARLERGLDHRRPAHAEAGTVRPGRGQRGGRHIRRPARHGQRRDGDVAEGGGRGRSFAASWAARFWPRWCSASGGSPR